MLLKIDCREKEFINALSLFPDSFGIEFEVISMEIGDIAIHDNSGNELIIIERKTLADLAASIKDGRYAEQSYRLTHTKIHNHNIIYLIEGNMKREKERNFGRIEPSTLYSAMVSLQYHKGFSVMRTNDITESVTYVTRLIHKLTKEKDKPSYYSSSTVSDVDYCSLVKREKKANITSENIGILMLSQIPGISANMAKTILDNKTLTEWIIDINDNPSAFEALRNKIHNKRRISKTVVNNLEKFLFS